MTTRYHAPVNENTSTLADHALYVCHAVLREDVDTMVEFDDPKSADLLHVWPKPSRNAWYHVHFSLAQLHGCDYQRLRLLFDSAYQYLICGNQMAPFVRRFVQAWRLHAPRLFREDA